VVDNTSQVGRGQVGESRVGAGAGGQTISMLAGGEILITGGVGASLVSGQVIGGGSTAWRGGEILISGGNTAVLLSETARNVTVLFDGVDRTEYVEPGIRRSVQTGGVPGSLVLNLNNGNREKRRPYFRPSKFAEVLCYVGTYRFFCGFVNTVDETAESGTSGLYRMTANCVSYAAILDYAVIGKHYEIYNGALLFIILADLIINTPALADRGITFGGVDGFGQDDLIQPFTINWQTMRQVCQTFGDRFTLDFYVDMWKVLRMFPKDTSTDDAPFAIATNNHLWKRMTVTRGGAYANYILVINSQDLGSIKTDEFVATAGQPQFLVTAALVGKPVVLVNDAAETVTDPGEYDDPWLWYWLSFTVVRNPANPLVGGENVKIKYPSDLSYAAIAKDDDEIAAHGLFMKRVDIKNATTRQEMQAIADGYLARSIQEVEAVVIDTDEIGLEPGQKLPIDTALPPVSDDFLIAQVDSVEVGKGGASARASKTAPVKGYFQHTVKATNGVSQRRGSGGAMFQGIFDQAQQAKDRQTYHVAFTLAETIVGADNPGLQVGIPDCPPLFAPRAGVAVQCALYFRSSETVLTDTDCDVDLLMEGVSIFPAGTPAKMVWKAGETVKQVNFIFASDFLDVPKGAMFLPQVIMADAKAKDGVIDLEVRG
jgi:hypothetical protein